MAGTTSKGDPQMRFAKLGFTTGVVLIALALAASASAGGNGAQTFTQIDKNVIEVQYGNANPCTGDLGTLTLTYNDAFHGTVLANGTSWFTGTITGSLVWVPDDSSKPTYTGHFAQWFGDENNLKNDVEPSTFNVTAIGSDGSHLVFHENDQAATNANGVVTVSFQHAFCA
jgi:hypothetical protein